MSSILQTFVRPPGGQLLPDAAREATDVLRRLALPPACRCMIVPGNPWLVIENLWFLTLKPGRGREAVETLAQLWSTEVVMIGTQSVASCGVYAHYLGGTLRRFLSAGDGVWLEVFGTPEFWEDGAFKNYSELPYALKAETTFSDSTVLDAAQAFGCPRIDATVEVVAVF